MHALACSEAITFEKRYPFEERELSYLVRVAEAVAGAGPTVRPTPREAVLSGTDGMLGACPYQGANPYLYRGQESVKQLFADLWRGFSRAACQSGSPRYYAEKVANDLPPLINEVLPAKNILLVRDPRAEMLSIMKFNRQRGYAGFGWLSEDDPTRFATRLCQMRRHFLREAARCDENPRRVVLRYEDIVLDSPALLMKLERFLGVDIDAARFHAQLGDFRYHMTSGSARRSIDAWRDELPAEAAEILSRGLKQELMDLGYA